MYIKLSEKTFAIGDLHLGDVIHAKQCASPDVHQHASDVINIINRQLVGDEELILLGDIVCDPEFIHYLDQINSVKTHYILGNRECRDDDIIIGLYKAGFIPKSSMRTRTQLFTHIPPHSNEIPKYDKIYHGHLHKDHIHNSKYVNCAASIRSWKLKRVN